MAEFDRRFAIERLSDQVLKDNAWLCDMLGYWRPSGGPSDQGTETSPKHLRLAIRKGYLNFYRGGQSIAKVSFDRRGKLWAKVHNKYVFGRDGKGQSYVSLTSAGIPEATGRCVPYDCTRHLDEWILKAGDYIGEEKRFVDTVVARNPNIIDLEMGLPAYSDIGEERRAPRMDLVNVEPIGHSWRLVFWEVKRVKDGRLRCEGPVVPNRKPEVLKQLGAYTEWLQHDNNCGSVASAYQRACSLLGSFHTIAKRFNPDIKELGPGILAIARLGTPPPEIDDKPRLLIDARKPDPTFVEHKHLEKLLNAGVHVQMVHEEDQMILEARS